MIDGLRLNRLFDCRSSLAAVFAAALMLLSASAANADDVLTIGDKAPELDIEHWLSDRDGEFSGFTGFEKDKVYIVEFWATWCGPCISSMPHIVETQDKYADKGVQIISVSREKLKTVEKFLKKKVRGEKEMTYAELTSAYCLTTDPDGSVSKDYMEAAGQGGIPTAFIVGKTGEIEWIGHPMEMDTPLEEIVEDKWDRESFAKQFAVEQKSDLLMNSLGKLMQNGKAEKALEKIDSFIEAESENMPAQTMARMKSIRTSIAMEVGGEVAIAAFKEMIKSVGDDAQQINQLTWTVVEQKRAGTEIDDAILKAACEAAGRGVKAAEKDGDDDFTAAMMDTHANLLYLCDKLEDAIAVQKKAAKLSDQEEILEFLEKLEAELAGEDEDETKDKEEEKDEDNDKG